MDVNEVKERINENTRNIENLAMVVANLKIRLRVFEKELKKK